MKSNALILILCGATLSMAGVIAWFQQQYQIEVIGYDFEIFASAARVMLAGGSPYLVSGFYNPFWTLIPIIPFAVLPEPIGYGLFASVNILLYACAAYRIGVRNKLVLLIVTVILGGSIALIGNIEGWFLLGMVLPPQIGMFFLMMKPQTGASVALVLAWIAYRRGGIPDVLRLVLPVLAGFAISFVLYGDWFMSAATLRSAAWNASLWPWSLVIGLPVLCAAIVFKNLRLALVSAPFLSPYVSVWAYGYVLIGVLAFDWSRVRNVLKDRRQ